MRRTWTLAAAPLGVALFLAPGSPALGPAATHAELGAPDADLGAPWISIEIPANPMDRAHPEAVAAVHTFYHERPADFRPTGSAEGVVKGERRSVPLEFERTARAGVWAVSRTWPAEGDWTLVIGTDGAATTLVAELEPDGGVSESRYYDWRVRTLAVRAVEVSAETVEAATARVDRRLSALAARTR